MSISNNLKSFYLNYHKNIEFTKINGEENRTNTGNSINIINISSNDLDNIIEEHIVEHIIGSLMGNNNNDNTSHIIIEDSNNNIISLTNIINTLNNTENNNEILSEIDFDNIRSEKFKNYIDNNNNGINYCSICLDKFNDNDDIKILECDHIYHFDCIKEWLLKYKNTCPICRH